MTPEGRRRSSRNSWKHGLYSQRVPVLTTEEQEEFDTLRQTYFDHWLPTDPYQSDLAEKIVDSEWRFLRFAAMEKWIVESMMSEMKVEVNGKYVSEPDPDLRAALAYEHLYQKNRSLENFQRERHRLSRMIDRFTRLLTGLQDQNPPVVSPTCTGDTENIGNEHENPVETPASDDHEYNDSAKTWHSPVAIRQNRGSEPPEVALAFAA